MSDIRKFALVVIDDFDQELDRFNIYSASVNGNATYTISATYSASGTTTVRCCEYDNSGTFISMLFGVDLNTLPKTFTTSANAKTLKFSLSNNASDVMLNEGSTALPYHPYYEWV